MKEKNYLSEGDVRTVIGEIVKGAASYTTKTIKDKFAELDAVTKPGDWNVVGGDETYRIFKVIGNIVSHQAEPVKRYAEGFTVVKATRPALFVSNELAIRNNVY